MKKFLFLTLLFSAALAGQSQSDKFKKAMEQWVPVFDTTYSADGFLTLSNTFQRIADAEKNQWLPYYYAALTQVNAGFMLTGGQGGAADKTDPIADKAEQLLNKAEELVKDNSEIFCVKKMIATLRMTADPMNRYMTYGPTAQVALSTAKKLNPDNPRVYLLEGQDKFYTPEQYGGSKSEAKKLFETAISKFDVYKPESNIHPNWGMAQLKYFMSQLQ